MKRFWLILAATLFLGAYTPPGPIPITEYTQVSATTLTSAVASGWMNVGGYSQLTFELAFVDANSSITQLDWSCVSAKTDAKPTGASATYAVKTMIISSSVATYTTLASEMAVTGSENFIVNMPINYRWINCTFSSGAGTPAAADTLQIDARASVE